MTLYALTGTPGTGKSSVSEELRTRGYDVVDGKRFIIEHGLMGELDEERDTHEVDLDLLNDALEPFRASEGLVILDSHLSHFMDSHGIIVLRCAPDVLAGRLEKEVNRVYLALDATDAVISRAVEAGADMLITHHPLIFSPLKSVTNGDFIGRRVVRLIQNDISYYAMHTNYDVLGMAELSEKILGINT